MLLWIDGFDAYGATGAPAPTGVVGRKYSTVAYESSFHIHAGRLSGYCLEFNSSAEYFITPVFTTVDATMIVGLAFKTPSWPSTGTLLTFLSNGTKGMNIRITSTGEVAVYLGASLLATTSGCGLALNAWSYIEFKATCGSSGSYELRIAGVNVLSNTVNTGAITYHNAFQIGETAAITIAYQVDDLYCVDGNGSVNSDFLGNQRVVTIYPTGDVEGYTDWTGSTGPDHYALVDENPANDDTDYVDSSTVDQKDLWSYSDVSSLGAVAGIQINTMIRETDATNFKFKTLIKSGSVESLDAGQVVGSTTYKIRCRVSETDPNTESSPWNETTVSAADFGVKVSS